MIHTSPSPISHDKHRASDGILMPAADWLRGRYHQHSRLLCEDRGWNLRLALLASDADQGAVLDIRDGRIDAIWDVGSANSSAIPVGQPPWDVVIRGPLQLLCDILCLRQPPSEPYLFGELAVSGPEPDFLRLDYIVSTLAQAEAQPAAQHEAQPEAQR